MRSPAVGVPLRPPGRPRRLPLPGRHQPQRRHLQQPDHRQQRRRLRLRGRRDDGRAGVGDADPRLPHAPGHQTSGPIVANGAAVRGWRADRLRHRRRAARAYPGGAMSAPSTTAFVVWTGEFEFTLSPSGSQAGEEEEVKIKGRCTACWGGLVLRGEGENGVVSRIECCVCKKKLVGEDAANAYHRVLKEATNNVWKMSLGFPPTRENSPFVGKLFPHLPRQTEDDVRKRIASRVERRNPRQWLTRRDFPLGDAAYLYLQARLFVATISDMYASYDEAVVSFRKAKTSDDPRHDAHDLNRRLGSTMARGMMSAFACELAMKAVSLRTLTETSLLPAGFLAILEV